MPRRAASAVILAAGTLFFGVAASAAPAAEPVADRPVSPGQITVTDQSEKLAPGITLRKLRALTPEIGESGNQPRSTWIDLSELRVDLTDTRITPKLVTQDVVPSRSRTQLNVLGSRPDLAAMVNADFFDIDYSNAAEGLELQDGVLRKGSIYPGAQYLAFDAANVPKLLQLAAKTQITIGSGETATTLPVQTFNDPGNPRAESASYAKDSIIAFTPAWGSYSRAGSNAGVNANHSKSTVEVLVTNDRVVSVANVDGSAGGPIPADSFYLEGRGTYAAQLQALRPGDEVRLSHGLADAVQAAFQNAVSGRQVLVRDGQPQTNVGTDGEAPRTSAGYTQDGKELIIVTVDGRRAPFNGPSRIGMGVLMKNLGAWQAINLDGGGSTQMVARRLGSSAAERINTLPPGYGDRAVPNMLGLAVAPGDGRLHELIVSPDAERLPARDPRLGVFPGLRRRLELRGADDSGRPATPPGDVRWTASAGTIDGGTLTAPAAGGDEATVTATASGAGDAPVSDTERLRLLGRLTRIVPSSNSLAFTSPQDAPKPITFVGYDADGYRGEIDPRDITIAGADGKLEVTAGDRGLEFKPTETGVFRVEAKVGDVSVPLQVDLPAADQETPLYPLATTDSWGVLADRDNAVEIVPNAGHDGKSNALKESYRWVRDTRDSRVSGATPPTPRLFIPAGTDTLNLWVKGDGSDAEFIVNYFQDGSSTATGWVVTRLNFTDWRHFSYRFPAGTKFPARITSVQARKDMSKMAAGEVFEGSYLVSGFTFRTVANAPVLAPEPIPVDPALTRSAAAPHVDGREFSFAALTDAGFGGDDPQSVSRALTAVQRARQAGDDFLLLTGDIAASPSALGAPAPSSRARAASSSRWTRRRRRPAVTGSRATSLRARLIGVPMVSPSRPPTVPITASSTTRAFALWC